MEPIFVNVGSCVMLEDKTVVKCVEDDIYQLSCDICAFSKKSLYKNECIRYECFGPHVHFEIVANTCDRCGKEVIKGDAVCEKCKIEELSNLF